MSSSLEVKAMKFKGRAASQHPHDSPGDMWTQALENAREMAEHLQGIEVPDTDARTSNIKARLGNFIANLEAGRPPLPNKGKSKVPVQSPNSPPSATPMVTGPAFAPRQDLNRPPYRMYGHVEVPNPIQPANMVAVPEEGEKPKSRRSIFGALKKRKQEQHMQAQPEEPIRRPQPHALYNGRGAEGLLAGSILGMSLSAVAPASPRAAQFEHWSAIRSRDMLHGHRDEVGKHRSSDASQDHARRAPSMADPGTWTDAQLSAMFQQERPPSRSQTVSPVDSGLGIEEDYIYPPPLFEPSSSGSSSKRSKSRISERDNAPAIDESEEDEAESMNRVLALYRALQDEVNAQQHEWANQIRHLEQQQEEALQSQLQEEQARLLPLEAQREEEARLAAYLAQTHPCTCCGEDKATLDFPNRPPTSTCTHPIQTCTECLQTWLTIEFSQRSPQDLKCPECPSLLSYNDMQNFATEATFESYENLLMRNHLSSLPEFGWCLAPKCPSGQLNAESKNFMDCAYCGYKQCLFHRVPWHTGETCSVYEYRTSGQKERDEERATKETLDRMSKRCPGPGCGWRIEKVDGCDHMTCKKCRFEFCWVCLASHKEIRRLGNTAHETWCKFHSQNLDVAWPFNVHAA